MFVSNDLIRTAAKGKVRDRRGVGWGGEGRGAEGQEREERETGGGKGYIH